MKLTAFTIIALLTGHSTFADTACDDLWFARNVIYDAHGYCFGSPLGKSMFDNQGCDSVDPELPADLAERVAKNWARYNSMKCNVDQSQAKIAIYNQASRAKILAQPLASELGNVCSNYSGPETSLHIAPNPTADKIGAMKPDDLLGLFHEPEGEWTFITVLNTTSGTPASGWASKRPTQCGS